MRKLSDFRCPYGCDCNNVEVLGDYRESTPEDHKTFPFTFYYPHIRIANSECPLCHRAGLVPERDRTPEEYEAALPAMMAPGPRPWRPNSL